MEMILKMFFLSLCYTNVKFIEVEKMTWKTYTGTEVLPIISQVKLIGEENLLKRLWIKIPRLLLCIYQF